MSLSKEQLLYLSALAYYNVDKFNKDNAMSKNNAISVTKA